MSDRAFWRTVHWVVLSIVAVFMYACVAGLREGM
jgi:hypothetical protein